MSYEGIEQAEIGAYSGGSGVYACDYPGDPRKR